MLPIDWMTVIVCAAINTPAVGGLLGWLGKQKIAGELARQDRELESLRAKYAKELEDYRNQFENSRRLLQGHIDKTVMVTRVHFETEFDALKKVFAKAAEVRLQLAGLRPWLSVRPADETKESKLQRLAEALGKTQGAYNELVEVSENLSPFYPLDIYEQFGECRKSALLEITDLQTTTQRDGFSSDWYHRGQENLDRFMAAYRRASDLIRERISKLAVPAP